MSGSSEKVAARSPKRDRGIRRVAAILEAAASLFAEKGCDAVTMTEVAARAGAPIGSLYQFFPSKEALADALLDRIKERLDAVLAEIEVRAASATVPDLVDDLLGVLAGLQQERAAASALIDSRLEASPRASELREALRTHVAAILQAKIPSLPPGRAEVMAPVVVQLMKGATRLAAEMDLATRAGVLNEMKSLLWMYLDDAIPRPAGHPAGGR